MQSYNFLNYFSYPCHAQNFSTRLCETKYQSNYADCMQLTRVHRHAWQMQWQIRTHGSIMNHRQSTSRKSNQPQFLIMWWQCLNALFDIIIQTICTYMFVLYDICINTFLLSACHPSGKTNIVRRLWPSVATCQDSCSVVPLVHARCAIDETQTILPCKERPDCRNIAIHPSWLRRLHFSAATWFEWPDVATCP